MIIIQVAGGLGNQMQQYAMYQKLKSLGREVKLDTAWFASENQKDLYAPRQLELDFFKDLPYETCTTEERDAFLKRTPLTKLLNKVFPGTNHIFTEREMYHPEIYNFTDKYLEGFFLCEKYYGDILPQLRDTIVFPAHSEEEGQKRNERLMAEMEERPSASVHLRRGDYLSQPQNLALFGNIATDAYYEKSMQYVMEKEKDVHFYIFSNDLPYVREHYNDPSRYTIVEGNTGRDSLLDMQLMSHCKYNICANSTFSFWGARLNRRQDKEMIRTYKMRNNQTVTPEIMKDYWNAWTLVDADGHLI